MISLRDPIYQLLKLAAPLCLTGLLSSGVFFFETLFLSRLGADALAAGALVSWLSGTIVVIIFGILSSINISVSHMFGAGDKAGIAWVSRDGFLLALLLVAPIVLLLWNSSSMLLLFGQNKEVVLLAKPYLHAWAYGVLPELVMIAILEVIMGLGHMRVILAVTVFEVSLSIILSYGFIFGRFGFPALGISGAGCGIALSYWLTTFALIIFVAAHKEYKVYFNKLFKWSKPFCIADLFCVGFPMGLMYCIEVAFFFAVTLIMGTYGSDVLAANQVVMQYNGLLISIIFSIAQAVTVRMGHLLGAKNTSAAKATGYLGVMLSGGLMVLAAIGFLFFPKFIIATDFDITLPQNKQVVLFATQFFALCAFFQVFESMRIAFFGALRALRDTRFTLFISIFSFWIVALPLGYYSTTSLKWGCTGLWWSMILSALLSVLLLAWRYKYKIQDYNFNDLSSVPHD